MLAFHAALHARSPDVGAGQVISLHGSPWQTLLVQPEALGTGIPALRAGFPISFEAALTALEKLPRMFAEPDGSFVWPSPAAELKWQVDGNLFDRDGRLLFVDLKGTCPTAEFDRLLAAFTWPETAVMCQLLREAVFLDDLEFRRFAAVIPSPPGRGLG
ncbi:MAG TPA: hypothetical protein VGJ15_06490 [Pirellulales bacterium]